MTTTSQSVDADTWGVADRVALVTGASSGLGRHFARVLARAGARVVVTARRPDRIRELVDELGPDAVAAVPLDIREPAAIDRAYPDIEQPFGPVEILVNNAGVGVIKPALEHSTEDWDSTFETNVRGPFLLSRLAVERRRPGVPISIVNVVSPAASTPARDVSAYAASKAALVQLTRVLALEWARLGVRVNAVAPGHVATELNPELADEQVRQHLAKRIPLGRLGDASDLDHALLLLAGTAAGYITGSVLAVDGGIGLRGA